MKITRLISVLLVASLMTAGFSLNAEEAILKDSNDVVSSKQENKLIQKVDLREVEQSLPA